MVKLSFKKQPRETGLASVAHPYPATDIKMDGGVVGHIQPPNRYTNDRWKIQIARRSDSEKCGWKWGRISLDFSTEPEAKEYIKNNWTHLITMDLYQFEED